MINNNDENSIDNYLKNYKMQNKNYLIKIKINK